MFMIKPYPQYKIAISPSTSYICLECAEEHADALRRNAARSFQPYRRENRSYGIATPSTRSVRFFVLVINASPD